MCNEREKESTVWSRNSILFSCCLIERETINDNLRGDIRTPFTSNQLNLIIQIQPVFTEWFPCSGNKFNKTLRQGGTDMFKVELTTNNYTMAILKFKTKGKLSKMQFIWILLRKGQVSGKLNTVFKRISGPKGTSCVLSFLSEVESQSEWSQTEKDTQREVLGRRWPEPGMKGDWTLDFQQVSGKTWGSGGFI